MTARYASGGDGSEMPRTRTTLSDPAPVPLDMAERVAYVKETLAMCYELEKRCFPPWRWLRWRRLSKHIKARNALVNDANAATRCALDSRQRERAAVNGQPGRIRETNA